MKKQLRLSLISSAVLLAASTACFAATSYKGESYKGEPPCPTPLMIKDGFYLGAQLGYDSYRVRNSYNAANVEPGLVATENLSGNPYLNATGWVGGLFGGYGKYFDTFYLGGELFVNESGAETSWTNTYNAAGAIAASYTAKVSVGPSWGVSLLPGLRLNDATLGYVRLGYERARIKGQENYFFGTAPLVEPGVSVSRTVWKGGFQYGLGLETTFYPNWDLRAEGTHVSYGTFNNNVSRTKFKSEDNQFLVGVSYHFA